MDNHKGADTAYPGVELLPDGTFVVTTYGHWTPEEEPYIVSVRFTLEELDARAKFASNEPTFASSGRREERRSAQTPDGDEPKHPVHCSRRPQRLGAGTEFSTENA